MQLLSTVPDAVPYVFLITDGAVDNEREICKSMQALIAAAGPRAPRISTFGIGTFCNYFFLKMLASIGRGLNDAVFNTGKVEEGMHFCWQSERTDIKWSCLHSLCFCAEHRFVVQLLPHC